MGYERARREEAEAVQRGELKFPGIGLASEDREHLERQLRLRGKRTVSPRGEGVDSGSPQSPTTPERRDEA